MMSILHITFYINCTLIESAAMNFEMIFEIKTLEDVMAIYITQSHGFII